MPPLLLIAGAIAGGILLYHLLKKLGKKIDTSARKQVIEQEKTNLVQELQQALYGETITQSSQGHWPTLPEKFHPIMPLWEQILNIVNNISFFEKHVIIRKKVGEEKVNSDIPTDDIEIQQISGINEVPRALPSELAAEDEVFYLRAATNKMFKQQPIEYQGVYEDFKVVLRKTLRVLQDVSGSTRGQRIAWSQILNLLLAKKARDCDAELSITLFNNEPKDTITATADKSDTYQKARRFINDNIFSNGGTDINKAIIYELAGIEAENKKLKYLQNTQIILITDGTEGVDEAFIKGQLLANQVKLHTVILGESNNKLKSVSDKYHYLDVPKAD